MTYQSTVLSHSPKHYWRLQETSGTVGADLGLGAVPLTLGTATLGQAGAYAGSVSNYINATGDAHVVASAISISSAAYSVSGLVKLDPAFPTTFHATMLGMYVDATQRMRFYIRRNATGNKMAYWDNTNTFQESSFAALDANWHHVGLVVNGTAAKTYLDGVPGAGFTITAPADTYVNGDVGRASSAGDYFKGNLQDVAIFPTALSDAQMLAQFNAIAGAPAGSSGWMLGAVAIPS